MSPLTRFPAKGVIASLMAPRGEEPGSLGTGRLIGSAPRIEWVRRPCRSREMNSGAGAVSKMARLQMP
jgi:hypothetical protein